VSRIGQYIIEHDLIPEKLAPDPVYDLDDYRKPKEVFTMYPNIFIAGASGTGKSTSLRNLDPETTIIINTERKVLPFRGAKKFKKHALVDSFEKFEAALNKALESPCKVIVIDSFTSLVELSHTKNVRHGDKSGDGAFNSWNQYYYALHDTLLKCKNSDKFVVFIGIDEIIQDHELRMIKTVAVQGQLKGKVEKEFEIVLWTHTDGEHYYFMTNTDGVNKAKTPMGMFESKLIDNDLNAVIKQIETYYQEEEAA
jgi:hypothetical protein